MTLVEIEKLIKELINKIDSFPTKENLEATAAKIIKDISDKIDNIEKEKTLLFNKNKEKIIEKDFLKENGSVIKKYSFPNFHVGNPSLGNSKSPNALKWPFGSTKNDE